MARYKVDFQEPGNFKTFFDYYDPQAQLKQEYQTLYNERLKNQVGEERRQAEDNQVLRDYYSNRSNSRRTVVDDGETMPDPTARIGDAGDFYQGYGDILRQQGRVKEALDLDTNIQELTNKRQTEKNNQYTLIEKMAGEVPGEQIKGYYDRSGFNRMIGDIQDPSAFESFQRFGSPKSGMGIYNERTRQTQQISQPIGGDEKTKMEVWTLEGDVDGQQVEVDPGDVASKQYLKENNYRPKKVDAFDVIADLQRDKMKESKQSSGGMFSYLFGANQAPPTAPQNPRQPGPQDRVIERRRVSF